MYCKWPHSAPFFIPPATAKFALEADCVRIHPPPVTKSFELLQFGGPWQVISACADEITRFVPGTPRTLGTITCSALTVMLPGLSLVCSLMMIWPPPGNATLWLGWPLTPTVILLIARLTISELPLVAAPLPVHTAIARDIRKSAEIVLP